MKFLFVFLALFVSSLLVVIVESRRITLFHSTDLHAWLGGHPHNPNLGATFGDYRSLLIHSQKNAENLEKDLLVYDTGDLNEGTGLGDASEYHGKYLPALVPPEVNALTIGNHDMIDAESAAQLRDTAKKLWGDKYVTTNTFFEDGLTFGSPYFIETLPSGLRILVMGIMYDFHEAAENVKTITLTKSKYFKEALKKAEDVDLVVCLFHIGPLNKGMQSDYKAIRNHLPKMPLILLTGHSHTFHFMEPDDNAVIFESGCYFAKLGVLELDLSAGKLKVIDHSWVDTNTETFSKIGNVSLSEFATPEGKAIDEDIQRYRSEMGLDRVVGCSTKTYDPNVPLSNPESLYSLYLQQAVPTSILPVARESFKGSPWFIQNARRLRSPLYSGEVTFDDIVTIVPFNDTFKVIDNVPSRLVPAVIAMLKSWGLEDEGLHPTENIDSSVPHYVWTEIDTSKHSKVAIISADYDIYRVQKALGTADPLRHWTPKLFCDEHGHEVLEHFVATQFPC